MIYGDNNIPVYLHGSMDDLLIKMMISIRLDDDGDDDDDDIKQA